MAEAAREIAIRDDGRAAVGAFEWTGLAYISDGGDAAAAFAARPAMRYPLGRDRSVQVHGTFGTGGHLKFYGSLDGINWAVLDDPAGVDIDFTSADIKIVGAASLWIKPDVTAGDGSTNLTAICLGIAGRP